MKLLTAYCILIWVFFLSGCKPRCELLRDLPLPSYMFIEPFVERIMMGDTLTLRLFAPYQSYRLDTGADIDVRNSSIGESHITVLTYLRHTGGGSSERTLRGYSMIAQKGSMRYDSRNVLRISYIRDQKGFVFEAKVVLTERGVVRFSHHRATGWMNGRCDKTIFWPLIGSPSQNEHLIFNFLELTPSPYQWENHYYVRVE